MAHMREVFTEIYVFFFTVFSNIDAIGLCSVVLSLSPSPHSLVDLFAIRMVSGVITPCMMRVRSELAVCKNYPPKTMFGKLMKAR